MVGAYGWGVLGDARGRRVGFAATAAFTFAFGILSAAAPNYLVRLSTISVQGLGFCWCMTKKISIVPLSTAGSIRDQSEGSSDIESLAARGNA